MLCHIHIIIPACGVHQRASSRRSRPHISTKRVFLRDTCRRLPQVGSSIAKKKHPCETSSFASASFLSFPFFSFFPRRFCQDVPHLVIFWMQSLSGTHQIKFDSPWLFFATRYCYCYCVVRSTPCTVKDRAGLGRSPGPTQGISAGLWEYPPSPR